LRKGGLFDFTSITFEKNGIKHHAANFIVYPIEK
jgi:hypothetical protein